MQHLDDGLLHALVDGEVPSAELGPIQAHLDGCADCRVRLDEARNMAGESNALIELIEVPAAREDSPAALPRPRRPGVTWLRPLALAASLALAVGLGYAGGALQRGVPEREMSSGASAFRIDTVFVAQDRAAAPAQEVAPPATVSPAPDPELAAGRRLAKTKEEREQADERQAAAPAPAELDRAKTPPAPTTQASRDSALTQRLRSSESRLNEVVVAGAAERRQTQAAGNQARDLKDSVSARDAAQLKRQDSEVKRALNEGAAKSVAAAPPAARQEQLVTTSIRATAITFYEATTLLGGQLRLIDGMVPTRLEQVGTAVRVVYSLGQGELFLEQRRDADSLAVVLIGPTLSPDSLGKLRQKIR